MRTLLTCCVLVMGCFSRVIEADEIDQNPIQQTPRVSDLLRDLSHPSARKRDAALTKLSAVTDALRTAALKERVSPTALKLIMGGGIEAAAENTDFLTDEERAAVWKKELPHLVPEMVEYLTWEPVENWQPVMELLVHVDASDFLPLLEREKVLRNDERRLMAVSALLYSGPLFIPRDRSLLAPIIKQLKALSPAMQQRIDEMWTSGHWPGNSTAIYSLAITTGFAVMNFALSDRFQAELPILASLIEKNQAPWLRKVALTALAELGAEAAPVLENVRRQLQDGDWLIRYLAAQVIVTINPKAVDISRLVKDANLEDEDAQRLRELAADRKRDIAAVAKLGVADDPESNGNRSLVLEMLQSRHQFCIRQGLRFSIEKGVKARFARQEIAAVLQMPQLDDETRRLAELATKAIDGK